LDIAQVTIRVTHLVDEDLLIKRDGILCCNNSKVSPESSPKIEKLYIGFRTAPIMKTKKDPCVRVISCTKEAVYIHELTRFDRDSVRPDGDDATNAPIAGIIWWFRDKMAISFETFSLMMAYESAEDTNED
jgi:hypothetical protein